MDEKANKAAEAIGRKMKQASDTARDEASEKQVEAALESLRKERELKQEKLDRKATL